MASALKRKRGPGEEVDTPKRAKAVKDVESLLPKPPISQISGWDAAFPIPPPKSKELITANGTNGSGEDFLERSHSPAAIHFDEYEEGEETKSKKRAEKTKPIKQAEKAKGERKLLKKVLATTDPSAWKVSDPIGGRQINMDPVFTEDEKYAGLPSSGRRC
jgi:NET1-associated nuclear protein 1 (U3 small nucleolar RNA-associated protein 17)